MDGLLLVHIPFTSTSRLVKPTHYFTYKAQSFKITRTTKREYADNLLTVVDSEFKVNGVARIAAEYFSALAWANEGSISFGQPTWIRSGRITNELRSARACIFDFHKIPFGRAVGGYSISFLPKIENEDQRLALALYREAGASNNDYLSFLFYWQVLAVGGFDPIGAANKARKRMKDTRDIDALALGGKSLGNHLDDDCRNAIAHVTRRLGETVIDFDNPGDRARIALSVRAVKALARHHIEDRLEMTKQMYLYQVKRGAVPEYLDAGAMPGRMVQPARLKFRPLKARS